MRGIEISKKFDKLKLYICIVYLIGAIQVKFKFSIYGIVIIFPD